MWTIFLFGYAAAALAMLLAWLLQLKTKNATLVDTIWTFGVGALLLIAFALGDGDPLRRTVGAILAGLWVVRLGGHMVWYRTLGHAAEDGRYKVLRDYYSPKAWALWSLIFFQMQAIFVICFAIAGIAIAHDPRPFGTVWDWVGLGSALVALANSIVIDRTLELWRADPANRGRTCRKGWWGWSRHPNYFFEFIFWAGFSMLTFGGGLWVAGLIQIPLVLLFVTLLTGIPHTERQALRSRGEDYRRYQKEVPVFLPWPPAGNSPS